MNYTKEIISEDGLTITSWSFMLFDNNSGLQFVLNSYYVGVKETKRHKNYMELKRYDRLSERDSNISEIDVPMPENILVEITEFLKSKIKVVKWADYRR